MSLKGIVGVIVTLLVLLVIIVIIKTYTYPFKKSPVPRPWRR